MFSLVTLSGATTISFLGQFVGLNCPCSMGINSKPLWFEISIYSDFGVSTGVRIVSDLWILVICNIPRFLK